MLKHKSAAPNPNPNPEQTEFGMHHGISSLLGGSFVASQQMPAIVVYLWDHPNLLLAALASVAAPPRPRLVFPVTYRPPSRRVSPSPSKQINTRLGLLFKNTLVFEAVYCCAVLIATKQVSAAFKNRG